MFASDQFAAFQATIAFFVDNLLPENSDVWKFYLKMFKFIYMVPCAKTNEMIRVTDVTYRMKNCRYCKGEHEFNDIKWDWFYSSHKWMSPDCQKTLGANKNTANHWRGDARLWSTSSRNSPSDSKMALAPTPGDPRRASRNSRPSWEKSKMWVTSLNYRFKIWHYMARRLTFRLNQLEKSSPKIYSKLYCAFEFAPVGSWALKRDNWTMNPKIDGLWI